MILKGIITIVNCPYCSHAFLKHDDRGCKSSGCDCKYKYTEYGWEKVRDPSLPPLIEEDKIVLLADKDRCGIRKSKSVTLRRAALVGASILLLILTLTYAFYDRFLWWLSFIPSVTIGARLFDSGLNARSRIMNNEEEAKP